MKLKRAIPNQISYVGEDDILNLGVDAAGLERAIQTVKNQLKELTGGLEEMIQVSVKSTKQGVKVTAQLTEQRNAGQKLKATLEGVVSETGKFDQGLKLVSGTLVDNTSKLEKQAAAQEKVKAALEAQIIAEEQLARKQSERIKNVQAILQSQLDTERRAAVPGGAVPNAEQARALGNALGRLAELQEKFKLRSGELLQIFARVKEGGVQAYTGIQRQVANAAAEVQKINKRIGTDAKNAIDKFNSAIRQGEIKQLKVELDAAARKAKDFADAINRVRKEKIKQVKDEFAKAARDAKRARDKAAEFKRLVESVRKQKIADVKREFDNVGNAAGRAGRKGQDAAQDITVSWRSFGRLIAVNVVSRAFGGLLNAFTESIDKAREFSISIAEIRTISRTAQLTTEAWADGVRDLSEAFGLNAQDVAEGTYQILSNQVAEGAEAFKFQREAALFARAAVASNADSVNLLTSAINAFGLEAEDANVVADIFFKTIELGRLRAADLSNTFGRVGNLANQLGVSLQEVTAGIATITIQGVRADEAITGLRNIFLKIIRPTDEMKELFKELGVETGKAAIETFGFAGFLQQLSIIAERDGVDKIGKLFGRIRAITAALQLGGAQSVRFAKSLDEIADSSGAATRAAQEVLSSIGARFEIELQKIRNFFTITIGQELLARILQVTDSVGGLARIVKAAAVTIGGTVLAFVAIKIATVAWSVSLVIAGVGVDQFTTRMALLNQVVKANPFFFILSAVLLVTAAISVLSSATRDFNALVKEELPRTQAQFSEFFLEQRRQSDETNKALRDDLDERFRDQLLFIAELQSRNTALIKATEEVITETAKRIKESTKSITKAFRDEIREAQQLARDAERSAQRASDNIAKITSQSIRDAFDLSLEGLTSGQFANKLRDKISDLTKILESASKGASFINFDRTKFDATVKEIQKRINQLDKQRTQSQDEIRRNEIAEVKLLEKQEDILRRFSRRANDLARKRKESRFDAEKTREIDRKLLRLVQDRDRALAKLNTKLKDNREETKALQQANINLAEIGAKLTDLAKRRLDIENKIKKTQEEQAAREKVKAEKLEASLSKFRETFRLFLEFDPAKAIEGGIDKAQKDLEKRTEDTLKTLEKLDPEKRAQIELEIEKQRAAQLSKLRQLDTNNRIKDARKILVEESKILQERVDVLVKERTRAEKELAAIQLRVLNTAAARARKVFNEIGGDQEKALQGFTNNINEFIKAGDAAIVNRIADTITTLGQLKKLSQEAFGVSERNEINKFIQLGVIELKALQDFLGTQKKAAADLKTVNASLDGIKTTVGIIDAPLKSIATSFKDAADSAERLAKAAGLLDKLSGEVFKPSINFSGKKAAGGQAGGLVGGSGRGDIIPAMLEPGEFIVNRKSTRDFFSQLVAINSGQGRGIQSGGVTNNVGDVNVTLQSVSQDVDARSIAQAVKQQLNRGTVRFRK